MTDPFVSVGHKSCGGGPDIQGPRQWFPVNNVHVTPHDSAIISRLVDIEDIYTYLSPTPDE